MLSRNRRLKFLLALIGVQIACLAVGLWIHYRLVLSSVYRVAEETALAELASVSPSGGGNADEMLTTIRRLDPKARDGETPDAEAIRTVLEARPTAPALQWTLVDQQWQVLAVLKAPDARPFGGGNPSPTDGMGPPVPRGEELDWSRSPAGNDGDTPWLLGTFEASNGRHVAMACRLSGNAGYVVAHRRVADVALVPTEFARSLPIAAAITLIWTSALLAVAVYMIVTRFHDELLKQHARGEAKALGRIQSLVRTRDALIFGLAKLAESRDEDTGQHLDRITAYVARLAAAVRHHPKYRVRITPSFIQLVGISSALHDIGKVGIEDSILLKPGPLTEGERARMQQHAVIGGNCLLEIERRLGASNFLQMAREIALGHHEHFDGGGYPAGLAGEEIPFSARLVAVADVYEALSSNRVYRAAMPHEKCVAIIRGEAGKQFDPDLVEAFLKIQHSFREIARRFGNAPGDDFELLSEASTAGEGWEPKDLVSAGAGTDTRPDPQGA